MKPYYESKEGVVYCGDCREVLKTLDANSIDTIITDPPYGLRFMGKKWDYNVPSIEIWKECLRVLKPGGTALIFAGSRTQHRMAVNVEDAGFELKDCIMWLYGSGFPKATDISKQLDKGYERKVIAENPEAKRRNKGAMLSEEKGWNANSLGNGRLCPITEPATPEAKLWNGWKSHGLKPAYEPVIVAMKPNEGTYANNALQWGVSGLNIDGGRIGKETRQNPQAGFIRRGRTDEEVFNGTDKNRPSGTVEVQGRYPANVILDEDAGKILYAQSGECLSGKANGNARISENSDGVIKSLRRGKLTPRNDVGGASRFFYCAKASKKERGEVNNHPTVKPLSLMEYLCTLTKTPTNGVVLDPFAGSGTTLIACYKTGRQFIGIEKEEKYCKISVNRIKTETRQRKLFE